MGTFLEESLLVEDGHGVHDEDDGLEEAEQHLGILILLWEHVR